MRGHRFKLGETVHYFGNRAAPSTGTIRSEDYEVVRLLPGHSFMPDDPQYQLKKLGSSHRRIAKESEIQPLNRSS